MTFKTDDRVYETSVTTGTGTYTLDGAQTGFTTFSGMGANNDCPYFSTDDTNWEVGIGTVLTGPARLQRTTILRSSNADAAVNWGAGTRKIRCGWPAAYALERSLSKSVAGSADVTLTQDEQRRKLLILTGVLTGNINVITDATVWDWIVYNNTSGAYTLTVKTSGGTGIAVKQGKRTILACDGTNVVSAIDSLASLNVDGSVTLALTSGVVGIGAVANAGWSGKVQQVGNLTALAEVASVNSVLYGNLYYDGSNTRYTTTAPGSYYLQTGAQHTWATAVSGTAGNVATTVNAMVLDASSLTIAGATATKASGTTWANPSDIRVKNFTGRYTKGIPELMQLQFWTGEYNGLGGTPAGTPFVSVKAQDVQQFLPSTISTYRAKLNPEDPDETDILRWDSSEVVPILVNAMQAQQATIESLCARIAALESR